MTTSNHNAAGVLRISEIDFCAWLGHAEVDDAIVYHRGFLALDVSSFGRSLSDPERIELCRVARRAWWAAERGLVHLMQRRHGADDFSYLAIARTRPEALPISLSSLLMEAA